MYYQPSSIVYTSERCDEPCMEEEKQRINAILMQAITAALEQAYNQQLAVSLYRYKTILNKKIDQHKLLEKNICTFQSAAETINTAINYYLTPQHIVTESDHYYEKHIFSEVKRLHQQIDQLTVDDEKLCQTALQVYCRNFFKFLSVVAFIGTLIAAGLFVSSFALSPLFIAVGLVLTLSFISLAPCIAPVFAFCVAFIHSLTVEKISKYSENILKLIKNKPLSSNPCLLMSHNIPIVQPSAPPAAICGGASPYPF